MDGGIGTLELIGWPDIGFLKIKIKNSHLICPIYTYIIYSYIFVRTAMCVTKEKSYWTVL